MTGVRTVLSLDKLQGPFPQKDFAHTLYLEFRLFSLTQTESLVLDFSGFQKGR